MYLGVIKTLHSFLRPNRDTRLAVIFAVILFTVGAVADDAKTTPDNVDVVEPVEVHVSADPYASYGERRTHISYRIGASYETVLPTKYVSPADGANYKSVFGSNYIPVTGANLGIQFNTGLGALYIDGVYGFGNLNGLPGTASSIGETKYGGAVGILFDKFSTNPWLIPYGGIQVVYIKWRESAGTVNVSGTTASTTVVVAGISIPLNFIDSDTARIGIHEYGIKNTFLDIFGNQYMSSNSSSDPNLITDWNVGAGFHIEF